MKRLDALLSSIGYTRKEAQILIRTKKVKVNGIMINICSYQTNDDDVIEINGTKVETNEFVYLLLNKPYGYVCTTEDTPDSVLKLIPSKYYRKNLAPVGRLDKDSEGLLILSNDGKFAHEIISPNKNIKKTYYIETDRPVTDDDIEAFKNGIVLSDGTHCLPAELSKCEPINKDRQKNASLVEISEGKYHQIKRMIASRNNKVTRLIRIKIGAYSLDGIDPGQVIEIKK